MVTGEVTADDGSRTPRVTLTLSLGDATVATATDAGGVFLFPAVVPGVWTLSIGALPSNWSLAPGQAAERPVQVEEGGTVREVYVLLRTEG